MSVEGGGDTSTGCEAHPPRNNTSLPAQFSHRLHINWHSAPKNEAHTELRWRRECWLKKLYESVSYKQRAKSAHLLFFSSTSPLAAIETYLQTFQARAFTPTNSLSAHKNSLHIHSGKQQHYAFCYTAIHRGGGGENDRVNAQPLCTTPLTI